VQLEWENVCEINVETADFADDSERNTSSTVEMKDNALQVQSEAIQNIDAKVSDQKKSEPQTFVPPRTRKVFDLPLLPHLTHYAIVKIYRTD
jgi:hypothetical protein